MEKKPREVPGKAKQTGEALRQKLGAEPCVWTERMLAALQTRVKGGKKDADAGKPTSAGPMPTLPNESSSPWKEHSLRLASLDDEQSSTGELDARDPHVQFGGRGGANPVFPTPIGTVTCPPDGRSR